MKNGIREKIYLHDEREANHARARIVRWPRVKQSELDTKRVHHRISGKMSGTYLSDDLWARLRVDGELEMVMRALA